MKEGYDEGAFQDTWDRCYNGIRQATIFMQNVDMNDKYKPEEIVDLKAQARFVRAYFYWIWKNPIYLFCMVIFPIVVVIFLHHADEGRSAYRHACGHSRSGQLRHIAPAGT